jgi:hypothetical protein
LSVAFLLTIAVLGIGAAAPREQAQSPPRAAQATDGTGAISGVVVDGATGRPVPAAVVSLAGPRSSAGDWVRRKVTDDLGRFVFTRLPAFDDFTLSANKNGFTSGRFGQDVPRDARTAPGRRIVLAEGQWFSDARVTIWRPGSIGGRVLDEAGEPVVGVPVRVLAQVSVAGRTHLAAGLVGRTDDRGVYRIAGLEPGRYLVAVPSVQSTIPIGTSSPGLPPDLVKLDVGPAHRLVVNGYVVPPPPSDGRARAYAVTYYPAAQSAVDAAVVELPVSQQLQGIDIQLSPIPSVRVSGVVDAPLEASVGGLTLRLMPAGAEALGIGSEAATAVVSPSGSFTFLNVPAGRYTIIASRSVVQYVTGLPMSNMRYALPGLPGSWGNSSSSGPIPSGSAGTSYVTNGARGPAGFSGRVSITVGDRNLTGVVVPFGPTVTISGRVAWDGEPSAGDAGSLRAEPAYGDPALGILRGSLTRTPGGTFAVTGLLAGEYTLRFTGLTVRSITWQERDYTYRPFDVSDGHDITDVVVTFTTKIARVSGAVRTEQGGVANAAAVLCFPVDRARWSGYGFEPTDIVSDLVSPSGAYRLTALPGGDYFVIAVESSFADAWQAPTFLEAAAVVATRVSVDWGESKTVDLTMKQVRWR